MRKGENDCRKYDQILRKECCRRGWGKTRNLLITSQTSIQLSHWGRLQQISEQKQSISPGQVSFLATTIASTRPLATIFRLWHCFTKCRSWFIGWKRYEETTIYKLYRGSPKEHFCKIILKSDKRFLTRRFFKFLVKKSIFSSCDLDMQWTGTIWTTMKEDQPRIIPVKFGQNPISGLGGDVV